MSENPARSEIDTMPGAGWGAPLKADFGPVDIRRPGLLFNGLLARGSNHPGQASLAGPPLGTLGRMTDGTSARAATAPITAVRPRPAPLAPAPAAPRSERVPTRRPSAPQLRTITHLDLRSVARVSAVFYGIVLIVMVVASVLLWVVADVAGAVHSIDHSVQSLFGLKQYRLHPTTIALYSCAAGLVVAVTGVLVNVLAASVYNLVSDVVGGIRVRVTDS
jgi:hypothetical protein